VGPANTYLPRGVPPWVGTQGGSKGGFHFPPLPSSPFRSQPAAAHGREHPGRDKPLAAAPWQRWGSLRPTAGVIENCMNYELVNYVRDFTGRLTSLAALCGATCIKNGTLIRWRSEFQLAARG